MPDIFVEIKGLKELRFALVRYSKISEPILQKAIVASAAEIQKAAVPPQLPWRTGRLTQSFGEGVIIGRLFAQVSPAVKYAVWVHEGTPPHTIRPRIKKALFWEGAAHPFRKVNHPGTRPNPFMDRVLKKAQPEIDKHFIEALDLINQKIADETRII
jgi:hypothetical protein